LENRLEKVFQCLQKTPNVDMVFHQTLDLKDLSPKIKFKGLENKVLDPIGYHLDFNLLDPDVCGNQYTIGSTSTKIVCLPT